MSRQTLPLSSSAAWPKTRNGRSSNRASRPRVTGRPAPTRRPAKPPAVDCAAPLVTGATTWSVNA